MKLNLKLLIACITRKLHSRLIPTIGQCKMTSKKLTKGGGYRNKVKNRGSHATLVCTAIAG